MYWSMSLIASFLTVCLICLQTESSFATAYNHLVPFYEYTSTRTATRTYDERPPLATSNRLSGGINQDQLPLNQQGRSKLKSRLMVLRGGVQHGVGGTSAPAMSSKSSSQANTEELTTKATDPSWPNALITRFLRMFFKGMTLPFPMLRELGSSTDTPSSSSSSLAVMGFPLRECLLAIGSYLCLGTLSYSILFEKWSLIDSLYFSVVTFTSVGYGDLTPTTCGGKLFTCIFGLSGLAFLGAAISTIGSSLIQKQEKILQTAQDASRKQIKDIFEGMPHIVKSLRATEHHDDGKEQRHEENQVAENYNVTATTRTSSEAQEDRALVGWKASVKKTLLSIVPALSFLWVGGIIMMRVEGWTWTDSIYYSMITGSTIGFGDFFPKTPLGRTCGIVFIPLAVAAVGDVLGNIGSSLIERRQSKVFKSLVTNRDISMDNLRAMDDDGNGKVSREEYVRFMLTEMGMVDSAEFDELYEQFGRLDADGGGYLDKRDLQLMAMHRAGDKTSI